MNEECRLAADNAAGYVLGALSADEDRFVRDHLASCREAHPEFAELGGVVPYLGETAALVEPPASLKDRILAAAAADLAALPRHAPASSTSPLTAVRPAARAGRLGRVPSGDQTASRRRQGSALGWLVGLAAVVAVVALGAWNVVLRTDLEDTRQYATGLSTLLDIAAQPGSQTAVLRGQREDAPAGIAAVGSDGRVALVMRGLPPTTGTEVYQAWVIGSNGTPRPIGSLSVGGTRNGAIVATGVPAEAGVTVALTREPTPGATTPTLPIVSAGVARSPAS